MLVDMVLLLLLLLVRERLLSFVRVVGGDSAADRFLLVIPVAALFVDIYRFRTLIACCW